jgi:hypothetical protein
MAAKTRIKILTTGATTSAPAELKTGELAYSYVADNGSNNGDRLYIGASAEDAGTGFVTSVAVIGGKYFTDMMDHAKGSLIASSALITDSDSKLAQLKVDDLDLNGYTITNTATNGSIVLSPNGTGVVNVPDGYKERTGFGDDSLVTKEYVDSVTSSLSASLTISDGTTADVITVGTDTLSFTGSTGIDTTVSDNEVTFAIDSAVATLTGTQTLTNKTLTAPVISSISNTGTLTLPTATGTVALTSDIPTNNNELTNGAGYITSYSVTTTDVTDQAANLTILTSQLSGTVTNVQLTNDSVTVGTTEIDLGASATDITGLTSVVVDDLTIDGSTISTTANNTNLVLSPHGTGTVTLPAGYELRGGFSDNSLVPKSYVDALAEGLTVHEQVHALVDSPLATITGGTIAYLNGSSGEGATLTVTGATYDFADGDFDGVIDITTGDRVIINGETNGAHNGIYVVSSATVLTRAADFDTSVEMAGGDFVFVDSGTVYENSGFVLSDPVGTVGTDDVTFTQFSGLGQVTAGAGLTKTGNQIDAVGTANRISVAADTIDIASTYVGQNTITTLGTIATGVWNGTTVGVQHGGTGLATVTSNGVVLGNGTNALSATAASTADGSILQADSAGTPAFSNVIDGGDY